MASANWKPMDSAPKDGTKVLLIVRLNIPGEEPGPVVGHWLKAVEEWRVSPDFLDEGTELIPSCWMEIPQFPGSR